jgi:hypothetical protein
VLANLAQGRCAKSSTRKKSDRTKCDTTWTQRDPEFAEKMAEVLCVYRQVKILKEAAAAEKKEPNEAVAR